MIRSLERQEDVAHQLNVIPGTRDSHRKPAVGGAFGYARIVPDQPVVGGPNRSWRHFDSDLLLLRRHTQLQIFPRRENVPDSLFAQKQTTHPMINLFLFFLAPISALKSFVLSDCKEHLFWKRSELSNPTQNQRPHKLLTTNREEETHLSQSSLIRMTKKGHLLHGTSQLPQIVNKKRLLYEQGNLFFLPAGLLCSSTKELQYFHRDVNDQNSCFLVLTPESEHVPLLPSSILCSIAPKILHKLHFIEYNPRCAQRYRVFSISVSCPPPLELSSTYDSATCSKNSWHPDNLFRRNDDTLFLHRYGLPPRQPKNNNQAPSDKSNQRLLMHIRRSHNEWLCRVWRTDSFHPSPYPAVNASVFIGASGSKQPCGADIRKPRI